MHENHLQNFTEVVSNFQSVATFYVLSPNATKKSYKSLKKRHLRQQLRFIVNSFYIELRAQMLSVSDERKESVNYKNSFAGSKTLEVS